MKLPYVSGPGEIPIEDYHGDRFKDFASSSILKQIMISPLWLKYFMEHPEEDDQVKQCQLEGNCYHSMLESIANTGNSKSFEERVALFEPPINPSTERPYGYSSGLFINAYQEFIMDNPDKEIYSQIEYENTKKMLIHLRSGNEHLSPIVNKLLKIGQAEVSILREHRSNDFIQ